VNTVSHSAACVPAAQGYFSTPYHAAHLSPALPSGFSDLNWLGFLVVSVAK
jgi:hypothetical protein